MKRKAEVILINLLHGNQYPSLSTANIFVYAHRFDNIRKKCTIIPLTYDVSNFNPAQLLLEIQNRKPSIIGFSCYLWNIREYITLLPRIKESSKDSIIIFGGPEAYPGILHDIPEISAVVLGEGEQTFKEILDRFIEGDEWEKTRGIAYRMGGDIKINQPRKPLENLDEIPSPYLAGLFDKMDVKYVEYSRGCKYRCSFCVGAATRYRHISIERIEAELTDCALKKQRLQLWAGAFINHKSFGVDLLKLVQRYRLQGKAITLIGNIFVDANNYSEEFGLLLSQIIEKDNRVIIGMGPQCCDEETMRINKRINNFANIRKNAALFRRLKLNFITDLIIGLPGDNLLRVVQSIVTAVSLEPQFISINILRLIPNTMLFMEKQKLCVISEELPHRNVLSTFSFSAHDLKNTLMMAASFLNEFHAANYNIGSGRL